MTRPLGLVGGYLGAGKTTMINRLLASGHLGRLAVVVNDFGGITVDGDLITSSTTDTIELSNGCVCCQITDDFSRTLAELAARRDLDHVLCEVSGVGDPGRLAVWQTYPGFSAGPVLVCVDATGVQSLLHDDFVGDVAAAQLGSAESLLVTKTDLVSPAALQDVVALCRRTAPGARLVLQDPDDAEASAAEAYAHALGTTAESAPAGVSPPHVAATGPGHTPTHAGVHSSLTLTGLETVPAAELATVLSRAPEGLIRAKGTVRDVDGSWHEIQLAADRVEHRRRTPEAPEPERPGLVLIASGDQAEEELVRVADELRAACRLTEGQDDARRA